MKRTQEARAVSSEMVFKEQGALRALLVDDSDDDLFLTDSMLRKVRGESLVSTWAGSYEEALALVGRETFDVILVDYRLGSHTGLELLGALGALGCRAPIILLTGVSDRRTDEEASYAGAMDYLVKGEMTPALLDRSIRYAIETKRVMAHIEEREQKLRRQQQVLSELAKARLSQPEDLETSLSQIARAAAEMLAVSRVSLWLKEPGTAEMNAVLVYEHPHDRQTSGPRLRMDAYPRFFDAILAARPVIAEDVLESPFTRELAESYLTPLGICSMLAAPLRGPKGAPGMISCEQVGTVRPWGLEEQSFVASISDMAALALESWERRKTEAELRAAKEAAEAATRAKSAFLAHMSHELRTPMHGVIGMTQLLLQSELSTQQREYAETVVACSRGLMDILTDVLDFSKIEAGRLELERVDFDMAQILDEVLLLLANQAGRKGLEVLSYLDPSVPRILHGDSARLRQVLVNLVSNAIKFTDRGHVSVEVHVPYEAPGGMLQVSVADTGIGIAESAMSALFAPFSQGDVSTTRRFGGTGLGLAICKQLVHLMGGEIGVSSQPDVGSRFWFTVPLAVRDPTPHTMSVAIRQAHVLLVDGPGRQARDTVVGAMLVRMCTDLGLSCTVSPGPLAASERLQKEGVLEPDLIIVDLGDLADGDYADAALLRQAAGAVPIVALTRFGDRGSEELVARLGYQEALSRPVRQSAIRHCLERWLGLAVTSVEDAATAPHSRVRAAPAHQPRVLVVEDNAINQRLASHQLRLMQCLVTCAEDGQVALETWERQEFDLILMDCLMPRMDGFEATQRIREREKQRGRPRTPIVAMTANAFVSDREKCITSGMDDFLSKPVLLRELERVLQQWYRPQ